MKSSSRLLEQFFLTVGQNNFGNKIQLLIKKNKFFDEVSDDFFSHFSVSRTHSQGHEDPAFGVGQFPHRGPSTSDPAAQRRSSSGTILISHLPFTDNAVLVLLY